MMMFAFHIAVGIMLIALVAGMLLYIKAKKNGSSFGKFIGILVVVLALFHLACTAYYGISHSTSDSHFCTL